MEALALQFTKLFSGKRLDLSERCWQWFLIHFPPFDSTITHNLLYARCMLGITESVFTPLPANINSNKQMPIPLASQRQEVSEKRRQACMNAAQNICIPKAKPPVTDCLETGPPLSKMPRFEVLKPPLCDHPPPPKTSLLATALSTPTPAAAMVLATQSSTVTSTGEIHVHVTTYAHTRTHTRTRAHTHARTCESTLKHILCIRIVSLFCKEHCFEMVNFKHTVGCFCVKWYIMFILWLSIPYNPSSGRNVIRSEHWFVICCWKTNPCAAVHPLWV